MKNFDLNYSIEQWFYCAKSFLAIPKDIENDLKSKWAEEFPPILAAWSKQFFDEIYNAKRGYSASKPSHEPYTELLIENILTKYNLLHHCEFLENTPTLVLSHDIDHLAPSAKLAIKTFISQRKIKSYPKGFHFLDSLESYLKFDATLLEKSDKKSTVFIANPIKTPYVSHLPFQWLIDPSYNTNHSLFNELKDLMGSYQCEIGLHGSYYSLSHDLIQKEKTMLEQTLEQKIELCRQHWLHLPNSNALNHIKDTGFTIDSTLGWNGGIGFRGGMARPFKLLLPNGCTLWEVPLLLMDGPLYVDLGLNHVEAAELGCKLLNIVQKRKGCVALNWHDRSASPEYQWDISYKNIVEYAHEKAFNFKTFSDVVSDDD